MSDTQGRVVGTVSPAVYDAILKLLGPTVEHVKYSFDEGATYNHEGLKLSLVVSPNHTLTSDSMSLAYVDPGVITQPV